MPWSNNSGGPWGGGDKDGRGDNRGQSPWGGGNGGGDRDPQREVEQLLRRGRDRMKSVLGGGGGGRPSLPAGPGGGVTKGGLALGALAVLGFWAFMSFYRVEANEQAVVLRFGEFHALKTSGLRLRLWPIDSVEKVPVTELKQTSIGGYARPAVKGGYSSSGTPAAAENENLMLTGDENIIDIQFKVLWRISDAQKYLFNIKTPVEDTVRAVAESAMREVVGRSEAEFVRTTGRQKVMDDVLQITQTTLDSYGAGVLVTQVQLEKADPPARVIEAFRDVQAAQQDQETTKNEADAYRNKTLAAARGEAASIAQQAEAYKAQAVAEATGEVSRFSAIYNEYKAAPEIVRTRMYLEAMERVLAGAPKVILDQSQSGAVPFLPLESLKNRTTPAQEPR